MATYAHILINTPDGRTALVAVTDTGIEVIDVVSDTPTRESGDVLITTVIDATSPYQTAAHNIAQVGSLPTTVAAYRYAAGYEAGEIQSTRELLDLVNLTTSTMAARHFAMFDGDTSDGYVSGYTAAAL